MKPSNIFLESISIIVIGGCDEKEYFKDVEILGDNQNCRAPDFPKAVFGHPSVFQIGEEIVACGGIRNRGECFRIGEKNWLPFINLTNYRTHASSVSMSSRSFIFGGRYSRLSSEILQHNSDTWQQGPEIPYPGIESSCVIRLSENELIIIGGYTQNIAILNTENNTWRNTTIQLESIKFGHRCIYFM